MMDFTPIEGLWLTVGAAVTGIPGGLLAGYVWDRLNARGKGPERRQLHASEAPMLDKVFRKYGVEPLPP
jgi:hypothetical protein